MADITKVLHNTCDT